MFEWSCLRQIIGTTNTGYDNYRKLPKSTEKYRKLIKN